MIQTCGIIVVLNFGVKLLVCVCKTWDQRSRWRPSHWTCFNSRMWPAAASTILYNLHAQKYALSRTI